MRGNAHRPWPRANVALTGFMGAGKTACGRLAAERWRAAFIDLDERIEEREGATVEEIFASRGESAFRELERRTVLDACRGEGSVIACGGGVVLLPENRAVLRRRCLVIWLQVSADTVLKRLQAPELSPRPLLSGADAAETVRRLLTEREPLYRQADVVIPTDGRTVHEVADEIIGRVTGWKGEP
jgi:shikimate kinase